MGMKNPSGASMQAKNIVAVGQTVKAQGHGVRPKRSKGRRGNCLPENPPNLFAGSVKKTVTIVLLAASLLVCVGSAESQLMKGRDSDGKTRIILVTSEGKFILSKVDTLLNKEAALTDFPADSLAVTAALDSVTFSPPLIRVSITALDVDMYVAVNDGADLVLLEKSAVLNYTGWNEITKILAKSKTGVAGTLWWAGGRQ